MKTVATPIDLVQVRTFVHLYETRSVTATAELLHVTQPTVSYTLAKLRRRFGEELFVRTAQGLAPTPAATELYEPFRSALETIDRAAGPAAPFDPAAAEREFTVMLSEFGELSFLPLLLGRLAEAAPRARLMVRHLVVDDAPDLLTRGQVDLVVTSARLPEQLLVRRPFMVVDYVALAAADHPRLRGERAAASVLAAERFASVRGTTGHLGPVRLLERLGLESRVDLELSDYSAVPYVVAETALVAIVPATSPRSSPGGTPSPPSTCPGRSSRSRWRPTPDADRGRRASGWPTSWSRRSRPGASARARLPAGALGVAPSVDPGDGRPLPHDRLLVDQQVDDPGGRRRHLRGDLVHLHLGEELVRDDRGSLADEPGGEDAFGVRGVLREGRKEHHIAHRAVTAWMAFSIRSCRGRTAYSRSCA